MTELKPRWTNELYQVFNDAAFMEGLVRNTEEHMRIITEWLLKDGEPRIEDVATTIGVLLQASTEVRWGVGDILVAVDQRRQEMGRPLGEWGDYIRAVQGMLGGAVGYHTLWSYYSISFMVPKEYRWPDHAHTWYLEVGNLAGHMLAGGVGVTRDERRISKHNKVLELLADPEIEDMTISQLRRLKVASGIPVSYRFVYPQHVDAVHDETGEMVRFLVFVERPWSDDVLAAVHYLLWGLRILAWSSFPRPRLVRIDHNVFTRRPGYDEPWRDELVARLGHGPLAEQVYEATRLKWRIQDED